MASEDGSIKRAVRLLYEGRSRRAAMFRYGLIGFDLVTIIFFMITTPMDPTAAIYLADFVIGLVILGDFAARLWLAPSKPRMLRQLYTIADMLVIVSLLAAPLIAENLAFLRVLRVLRLLHSYHVLRDLRRETWIFRRHEDVIVSAVNLSVFIFVTTALVYVLQVDDNPEITSYIDALYFTIATLTTTGFGDITMHDPSGRVLAVVIMVVGVALFLRLAQTVFRPDKVRHDCPDCGLGRHDPDAVHCKHCGRVLKIETDGET